MMHAKLLAKFLKYEASSSLVLFGAAFLSLVWANSFLANQYSFFVHHFVFVINEGLMAIFFLLIGLEIKHGYVAGELKRIQHILLPFIAAVGGMVIPAVIYIYINYPNLTTLKGFAIPMATDIAFSLGVINIFGKRVPIALKLFLMLLAIFDDLGAILIICLFYSQSQSWLAYLPFLLVVGFLYVVSQFRRTSWWAYLSIGLGLWLSLIPTGIHPTVAGVILALFIPPSQILRLKDYLNPWVAFFIMPLFALANAGFNLYAINTAMMQDMVVWGIILGLILGKPLGVFGSSWLVIKLKWATLPKGSTWLALFGVALLCGIGFTMSLFLGTLSFHQQAHYLTQVRIGVMGGSVLAGLTGMLILTVALSRVRGVRS